MTFDGSVRKRLAALLVAVLLGVLLSPSLLAAGAAAQNPSELADPDILDLKNADFFWKAIQDKIGFSITQLVVFAATGIILLSQIAFPLWENSLSTQGNSNTQALRSLTLLAFGTLMFFLVGYGLYNPGEDYRESFVAINNERSMAIEEWTSAKGYIPNVDFLFQLACGCLVASIASAGLAGRGKFAIYPAIAVIVVGFLYPICGSWLWSGGWLSRMQFYDFGGSGLIHMLGGFAALPAAMFIGPRIDRFSGKSGMSFERSDKSSYATIASLIFLVGCFGLCAGRQYSLSNGEFRIFDVLMMSRIAVNLILAGAAGGVVGLILGSIQLGVPNTAMTIRGFLGGLVAIAAGCNLLDPKSAVIVGSIAGALVVIFSMALQAVKIDDALGVFPVHGVCGAWGLLSIAFFASFTSLEMMQPSVSDLKRDDQVMTDAGIVGKIAGNASGPRTRLEIAKDVRMEVETSSIRRVLSRSPNADKPTPRRGQPELPKVNNVELSPVLSNPYATWTQKGAKMGLIKVQAIGLAAIAAAGFLSMLVFCLVMKSANAFSDDPATLPPV